MQEKVENELTKALLLDYEEIKSQHNSQREEIDFLNDQNHTLLRRLANVKTKYKRIQLERDQLLVERKKNLKEICVQNRALYNSKMQL